MHSGVAKLYKMRHDKVNSENLSIAENFLANAQVGVLAGEAVTYSELTPTVRAAATDRERAVEPVEQIRLASPRPPFPAN